jgi:hypothetical protein
MTFVADASVTIAWLHPAQATTETAAKRAGIELWAADS